MALFSGTEKRHCSVYFITWHKIDVNYAGYNKILSWSYDFIVFSIAGPLALVITAIMKAFCVSLKVTAVCDPELTTSLLCLNTDDIHSLLKKE